VHLHGNPAKPDCPGGGRLNCLLASGAVKLKIREMEGRGMGYRRSAVFLAAAAVLAWVLAVSACEAGGDSAGSIPLAGPRSVQVTARDGALVLQWTKVASAQGIVPYYEVYCGTGANPALAAKWGDVYPDDSNLVAVTVTGLYNRTIYYVWVKAVYTGLGRSDFSPTAYGTPIPPPETPGPLTVTPMEEMLEVTWGAAADAFTYEVCRQAGSGGGVPPAGTAETMLTVSDPGAVILGLTNGVSYTVWVRAVNTAGVSPAWSQGAGTPAAAASAPPASPVVSEVTPGDGKLTLTWNQVSGVPRYKIYYGTADNFAGAALFPPEIPASVPRVSAELSGLANGVKYYVWVLSANSKGASPPGASASGTPQAKNPVNFNNIQFELGKAAAEYVFAQDLPPSVFFPTGRPNTDRLTRVQETALGNLFTDGAAWYMRKRYPGENIDFVFLNGGYIDNVLPRGTITVGSLAGIVKPDSRGDKFYLLTLTGTQLKQFFNDAADVVHTGRGSANTGFFGIVSKEARYTLQYYKPPEGTQQISAGAAEPYYHGFIKPGTLKINGADIVDAQDYRICTTDYLASGAWFTRLYTEGKNKTAVNTPFWHGVAEYIYDQGGVTPKLDGRIRIEGGVPLPAPWIPGTLPKP
jgi:hypothetical protein